MEVSHLLFHRIISNRRGHAIGLTACIGRAVPGCVDHIYDLLQDGRSVVLLGSPGVGMTTVLREISRVLSDVKKRRVVVIDTYNQVKLQNRLLCIFHGF